MKRTHKQMWRTVIALVLTFTLVFGTVSTAFATSKPSSDDVKAQIEAELEAAYNDLTDEEKAQLEELKVYLEDAKDAAEEYVATEQYKTDYAAVFEKIEAAGYIKVAKDALVVAQEALDIAKAEVKAFDFGKLDEGIDNVGQLNPEKMEATAVAAIENAKLTIAELDKVLGELTGEFDKDLETIAQLLDELEQNLADVYAALEIIAPYAAAEVELAYNEYVVPAVEALIDAIEAAIAEAIEAAKAAAKEAYVEFIDWLFAEFFPGADAALYDWFYNNPDKVIAFFTEYGDEMGAFFVKYNKEIAAVLGYVAVNYGEPAIKYAIENPCDALATWAKWYEKYGDKTLAMIDVYLNELGIYDAIDGITADMLEDLYALMNELGPEALAMVAEWAQAHVDEIYAALAEMEAEAKAAAEAFINAALKQIEVLEAQLAELYAQVEALKAAAEKAYGEAKAELEKQIAQLEKLIAQIEKQIDSLKAQIKYIENKVAELYDAVKAAEAAVKALIEAIEEGSVAGIKAALAAIQDAMNKVKAAIDLVEDIVDEINAAIEKAIAIIEAIEKAFNDAVEMIEKALAVLEEIDANIKELINDIKAAVAKVKAAVEVAKEAAAALKAAAEAAIAELEAIVEELIAVAEALYEAATTGYYTATEDSYYVALGDTTVDYAQIVADELDLDKDQFASMGQTGMRAEDLRMILDADYEADAYGTEMFGADVEALRAEFTAEIEKADLITLGFSNNTMTKFVATQVVEGYEMDWARYVGNDGAESIDAVLAAMAEELAAAGIDAAIAEKLLTAVEAYAYAYTGFACNYPEAANLIKAINPEAQVVLVGMYNPFENAAVEVGCTKVPVGDYIGALVDLANAHYVGYAMITGNAIYVDAPNVETNAPFAAMGIEAFVAALADLDSLEPSADGHAYIAEQILNALNVVDKDTYNALKAIEAIENFGKVTRDNLEDAKALAEAARKAWDALTDEQKAQIGGLEALKVLVDFELEIAYVELGIAQDIDKAETALAEKQAELDAIERALKITESTVTNLKAKVQNKSQIKVTWTAADVVPDAYRVTLLRAGKKVSTTFISGDKTTVTLKNLLRGTNFTVRVTPVAKYDGKNYFSIYKTSNKVTTKLQKANLTVKKSGKARVIKSADQNSTGFQIWISKDKNFKKGVTKFVYKTNKKGLDAKIKAKNFKSGKNYVKVRAYTKVNGKTVYGAWSGIVTVNK